MSDWAYEIGNFIEDCGYNNHTYNLASIIYNLNNMPTDNLIGLLLSDGQYSAETSKPLAYVIEFQKFDIFTTICSVMIKRLDPTQSFDILDKSYPYDDTLKDVLMLACYNSAYHVYLIEILNVMKTLTEDQNTTLLTKKQSFNNLVVQHSLNEAGSFNDTLDNYTTTALGVLLQYINTPELVMPLVEFIVLNISQTNRDTILNTICGNDNTFMLCKISNDIDNGKKLYNLLNNLQGKDDIEVRGLLTAYSIGNGGIIDNALNNSVQYVDEKTNTVAGSLGATLVNSIKDKNGVLKNALADSIQYTDGSGTLVTGYLGSTLVTSITESTGVLQVAMRTAGFITSLPDTSSFATTNDLTKKADQATVDTLSTKVDTKASLTDVASKIFTNATDITSAITSAGFAKSTEVNTLITASLATTASQVDVDALNTVLNDTNTKVAQKADNSSVTTLKTTVDGKADQSSLSATNVTVATKADQSSLSATNVTVATKASLADVANAISANAANIPSAIKTALGISETTNTTLSTTKEVLTSNGILQLAFQDAIQDPTLGSLGDAIKMTLGILPEVSNGQASPTNKVLSANGVLGQVIKEAMTYLFPGSLGEALRTSLGIYMLPKDDSSYLSRTDGAACQFLVPNGALQNILIASIVYPDGVYAGDSDKLNTLDAITDIPAAIKAADFVKLIDIADNIFTGATDVKTAIINAITNSSDVLDTQGIPNAIRAALGISNDTLSQTATTTKEALKANGVLEKAIINAIAKPNNNIELTDIPTAIAAAGFVTLDDIFKYLDVDKKIDVGAVIEDRIATDIGTYAAKDQAAQKSYADDITTKMAAQNTEIAKLKEDLGQYARDDKAAQKIYAELIDKKMAAQESSIIKNMLNLEATNYKARNTRLMTMGSIAIGLTSLLLLFLFY